MIGRLQGDALSSGTTGIGSEADNGSLASGLPDLPG